MNTNRWLYLGLIISISLIIFTRVKLDAKFFWGYPPLNTLVVTEYYNQDIAALTQGAHRVAANLAYIQLLQYYGDNRNAYSEEQIKEMEAEDLARGKDENDHDHAGHDHHDGHDHSIYEIGKFSRVYELGRRMLRLNPFFNVAALEIGGALAFNLKRNGEALDFLREAIKLDGSFYRYHLYIGAILFRNEGEDQKLVEVLDEAIQYSDCPPLLENILANLHRKNGNYVRSAEVYVHIINTSINEGDVNTAKGGLVSLIQAQPQVADAIRHLLQE